MGLDCGTWRFASWRLLTDSWQHPGGKKSVVEMRWDKTPEMTWSANKKTTRENNLGTLTHVKTESPEVACTLRHVLETVVSLPPRRTRTRSAEGPAPCHPSNWTKGQISVLSTTFETWQVDDLPETGVQWGLAVHYHGLRREIYLPTFPENGLVRARDRPGSAQNLQSITYRLPFRREKKEQRKMSIGFHVISWHNVQKK